MKLPGMSVINRKRDMINEFLGIDARTVISDGFFNTQKNVSMDKYPTMSRREGFANLGKTDLNISGTITTTNIHGVVVMNDYVYMVLEKSLYKFKAEDFPINELSQEELESRCIYKNLNYSDKQIVKMGAYIVILPDKIILNTEDDTFNLIDYEYIGSQYDSTIIKVVDIDGTEVDAVCSITEPEKKDEKVWFDISNDSFEIKMYSETYSAWLPVTLYWMYEDKNGALKFNTGETVIMTLRTSMSGGTPPKYSYEEIKEQSIQLYKASSTKIMWKITSYSPWGNMPCPIASVAGSTTSSNSKFCVKRISPDIDYICSYNNRLWACSSENHEIYASAQGNPYSWYQYQGITSDSYAATVGSEGDFTGCVAHLDNVLFFKEDRIIKVYGTKPANYQISELVCRGVKKGCAGSLVISDEILYYNSREGILAYDGSFPSSISERLDISNTKNINLSIALDKKVYFFNRYGNTNYVYDVKRGLWTSYTLPYGETNAVNKIDLFELEDEIYLCSTFGDMTGTHVYKMHAGECEEDTNEWKAVTGILGLDNPDNKYISMINIRINLTEGSTFKVSMQYDEGEIKEICRVTADTTKTFTIPIIPQRCDTFRMHLGGTGKFTLYSITKYTEKGSDVGSDM